MDGFNHLASVSEARQAVRHNAFQFSDTTGLRHRERRLHNRARVFIIRDPCRQRPGALLPRTIWLECKTVISRSGSQSAILKNSCLLLCLRSIFALPTATRT